MEDLTELIQAAKGKGIKLILDLVVNHSSDEHAWFQTALTDSNSPYRDYYIFKSGEAGNPPNNWRSIFGGSVWEPVQNEENMYYFHTFDKKQLSASVRRRAGGSELGKSSAETRNLRNDQLVVGKGDCRFSN